VSGTDSEGNEGGVVYSWGEWHQPSDPTRQMLSGSDGSCPDDCQTAAGIDTWSTNLDPGRGPFLLFLDLLGWSEEHVGVALYGGSSTGTHLGHVELARLGEALIEFSRAPAEPAGLHQSADGSRGPAVTVERALRAVTRHWLTLPLLALAMMFGALWIGNTNGPAVALFDLGLLLVVVDVVVKFRRHRRERRQRRVEQ
jgi:hypothetical protein